MRNSIDSNIKIHFLFNSNTFRPFFHSFFFYMVQRINLNIPFLDQSPAKIWTWRSCEHGVIGVSKILQTWLILTIFLIENSQFLNDIWPYIVDSRKSSKINTKTHQFFNSEDFTEFHFWKFRKKVMIDSFVGDIWPLLATCWQ